MKWRNIAKDLIVACVVGLMIGGFIAAVMIPIIVVAKVFGVPL